MQNNEKVNTEQENENKIPDGQEANSPPQFDRRPSRANRWREMFEPRPFSDKSSAQDNLIIALKNRNLEAFEQALSDPEVDPDYWYGKPYWSTCLQLAAQTEGCEPFVIALLKAGAGSPRGPRSVQKASSITSTTPPAIGVGRPNSGATGPEVAVDAASLEAAAGAAAVSTAAHRLSMISSTSPRTSWVGPPSTGQDDQQNIRYWLRDLGRAVREMSQYIGGELRTLSDHMEVMEERLAAMERSQQRTNESLRQLVGRRSETPH